MSVSNRIVPTIGVIAARLGVPKHRVEYVVKSRGIAPVARAGNARVFSDADATRISRIIRGRDVEAPDPIHPRFGYSKEHNDGC